MKPIRNSAKALIVKDGKLLCTKNEDMFGTFYLLPGGGQEKGETLQEALKRECMEEISAEVDIGELKFIREYIGKNHEFKEWDSEIHQVEFIFVCTIKPGSKIGNGIVPDSMQTGVEWLEISNLGACRLYPKTLSTLVSSDGGFSGKIYLGDTN